MADRKTDEHLREEAIIKEATKRVNARFVISDPWDPNNPEDVADLEPFRQIEIRTESGVVRKEWDKRDGRGFPDGLFEKLIADQKRDDEEKRKREEASGQSPEVRAFLKEVNEGFADPVQLMDEASYVSQHQRAFSRFSWIYYEAERSRIWSSAKLLHKSLLPRLGDVCSSVQPAHSALLDSVIKAEKMMKAHAAAPDKAQPARAQEFSAAQAQILTQIRTQFEALKAALANPQLQNARMIIQRWMRLTKSRGTPTKEFVSDHHMRKAMKAEACRPVAKTLLQQWSQYVKTGKSKEAKSTGASASGSSATAPGSPSGSEEGKALSLAEAFTPFDLLLLTHMTYPFLNETPDQRAARVEREREDNEFKDQEYQFVEWLRKQKKLIDPNIQLMLAEQGEPIIQQMYMEWVDADKLREDELPVAQRLQNEYDAELRRISRQSGDGSASCVGDDTRRRILYDMIDAYFAKHNAEAERAIQLTECWIKDFRTVGILFPFKSVALRQLYNQSVADLKNIKKLVEDGIFPLRRLYQRIHASEASAQMVTTREIAYAVGNIEEPKVVCAMKEFPNQHPKAAWSWAQARTVLENSVLSAKDAAFWERYKKLSEKERQKQFCSREAVLILVFVLHKTQPGKRPSPDAKYEELWRRVELQVEEHIRLFNALEFMDGIAGKIDTINSEQEVKLNLSEWVEKSIRAGKKRQLREVACSKGVEAAYNAGQALEKKFDEFRGNPAGTGTSGTSETAAPATGAAAATSTGGTGAGTGTGTPLGVALETLANQHRKLFDSEEVRTTLRVASSSTLYDYRLEYEIEVGRRPRPSIGEWRQRMIDSTRDLRFWSEQLAKGIIMVPCPVQNLPERNLCTKQGCRVPRNAFETRVETCAKCKSKFEMTCFRHGQEGADDHLKFNEALAKAWKNHKARCDAPPVDAMALS